MRLEGLDGVGKEVVRRALSRFIKKPESIDSARKAPDEWAAKAREHIDQEIRSLGKAAAAPKRPIMEAIAITAAVTANPELRG